LFNRAWHTGGLFRSFLKIKCDKSNLQQQVCSLAKGTPQQKKMVLRTLLLVGGLLCVPQLQS
jgi:hypothetical protein